MKPLKQIHWTLEAAASEFSINPRTLSKRLKANSTEYAFTDKTYSTKQICDAVFGDINGERLRNERADADLKETKLAILRREWVKVSDVRAVWEQMVAAWRNIVAHSETPEDVKQDLTQNLANIPVETYFANTGQPVEDETDEAKG